MLYKIFNGVPHRFEHGSSVPDLKYTGDIVMAIDPSKTNCAVVIGDPGGEVIMIVEMSGNNWKAGPVIPTTEYCSEIREFISRLIEPANLVRVGMEQAITKKGMEHHHSNMVLTEIRAAFLGLFWEKYQLTKQQVEVNNWTWKRAILPEGYRSPFEKGSMRYFWQYLHDNTYIHYFEDDVTDCMCIYKYLILNTQGSYRIVCCEEESIHNPYTLTIMPSWADELNYRQFAYNNSYNVETNATYFANRSKKCGIAVVRATNLSLADIYKYASGFMEIPQTDLVRLVVQV